MPPQTRRQTAPSPLRSPPACAAGAGTPCLGLRRPHRAPISHQASAPVFPAFPYRASVRRRGPLLALVSLALVLGGCGGGGELEALEAPGAAEQVLTRADVERQPEGSPERAVFAWWRAAQYSNLQRYLQSFSRDVRTKLERGEARRELRRFADAIRSARPEIVETDVSGNHAVVSTRVLFRQPLGLTRYVTTARPQAFELTRENGRWVLSDDFFVDILIGAVDEDAEESS